MYIGMQKPVKKQRNADGVLDYLDKVIGEGGIKTDVAVKIPPATVAIIIVSVFIAVGGAILIAGAIKKSIQKK